MRYHSGTIKIISEDHFYKVGTIWGSLKKEQLNISVIGRRFPELILLIPKISYRRQYLFKLVKMDRYYVPEPYQHVNCAKQILTKLSQYANKQQNIPKHLSFIEKGMRLVTLLYKVDNLEKMVDEILSLEWRIGPTHGDFHKGNILINQNGLPIMIDLDSFHSMGIQALDAFGFCVDWTAHEANISWQEVINAILSNYYHSKVWEQIRELLDNDILSLSILYLLYRLAYENVHYGFLSRSVKKEFSIFKRISKLKLGATKHGY